MPEPFPPASYAAYEAAKKTFRKDAPLDMRHEGFHYDFAQYQLWRIAEALEALVDVEGARAVSEEPPIEPWQLGDDDEDGEE